MQTKLEIARAIRGANYDCQSLWFFCGECPFDAFCSGAVAELSKVDISKHREAFVSQVNAFIKSEEGIIHGVKCPYCDDSGTRWHGENESVCKHCNGSGYIKSEECKV